VGEIGIPRHEFLYDLRFWEVRRIIRGYRRRNKLTHQLLAECAYATTFVMRDPQGKTVADMFPILFEDDYIVPPCPPVTDEDIADLQQLMIDVSAQHSE